MTQPATRAVGAEVRVRVLRQRTPERQAGVRGMGPPGTSHRSRCEVGAPGVAER
jgi:hypothetical protein